MARRSLGEGGSPQFFICGVGARRLLVTFIRGNWTTWTLRKMDHPLFRSYAPTIERIFQGLEIAL